MTVLMFLSPCVWNEKSFSGSIIQKCRIKLWNTYSGYNTRFFLNGLGLEAVSCNCSETDVCNLFYDTLLFHGQRRSFYYSAKITTSNYEFIFLKKSSLFFHLFCIFQCSLTSWYQFCPEQSKNFISIQNRGSSVWFLSVFFYFLFLFSTQKNYVYYMQRPKWFKFSLGYRSEFFQYIQD